jgi:two-component system response regulator TctD
MKVPGDPTATVIVCEPDEETLDLICDRLAADRFEPLPAVAAEEAFRLCRHHHPDLLVVDLELPEGSGHGLVRRIREADPARSRIDPRLAILALRPRDVRPEDRGREPVVDDHLDKPFSYEDLRARIRANLRRRHDRLDEPMRVGEILIDPARRKVTVGDRDVHLARKEFTLLRVLATDPARVFSKEELMRDVWGSGAPAGNTRTLDSHASRLRRKLDPDGARYVVNCWGIGYRLLRPGDDAAPGRGSGGGGR